MEPAILRQAFDGGDLAALGAERRHQAGVERLAVDVDRTGAAVARVAALLDAEHLKVAQERAQALAGLRLSLVRAAVHLELHCATSARICSARWRVTWRLYGADPCTSSNHASAGRRASITCCSSSADGSLAKRSCTGRGVAAVMVSRKSSPSVPIMSAAERPRWVSETWRMA